MSTPATVRPATAPPAVSAGLQALQNARDQAAREIAAAVQRVLPLGFRGRITLSVDNGVVRAQDVGIELRSVQTR